MGHLFFNVFDKMNYYGKKNNPFFFLVDFEMNHSLIFKLEDLEDYNNLYYWFNGKTNYYPKEEKKFFPFEMKSYPVSFEEYKRAFEEVKKEFIQGNSFLLNLTFRTKIEFNKDISLLDIFEISKANYKIYLKDRFVVFSPESFVKIINGKIYTFPMKGTSKSIELLSNEKELAEHTTVVDLLRNDLSMVARNVRVERFRFVDKIYTSKGLLFATSSEICGDLPSNYNEKIGDIIFQLLPAGSVSGSPKVKTVEIIKRVERIPRGYYCGICGIFDGNNLDSCVMIRFIEKEGDSFYYRSGGGVTIYSDCLKEYNEMKDKIYVPID